MAVAGVRSVWWVLSVIILRRRPAMGHRGPDAAEVCTCPQMARSASSVLPPPQASAAPRSAAAILTFIVLLILPIAHQAGPFIQNFLPIYASIAAVADLLTAAMLLGQFLSDRRFPWVSWRGRISSPARSS